MKCLHCGTDLDRFTKLRGAPEYCSESCKRAAEEEFNQMALSRLTRIRPLRTSARSQLGEVREVRSGGETLTLVNYRPGATSVIVTEPPEAGFVLDVGITLATLERQLPEPIAAEAVSPCLPRPAATPAGGPDALRALQDALRARLRPVVRPRRGMYGFCVTWLQAGSAIAEPPQFSAPDPVWPDRLALDFQLRGIEDLDRPDAPPPAPLLTPVPHAAIPAKRGPRPLPELRCPPNPGEPSLPGPTLSSPRLRIHLPRPSLQTLRPRYGFAPAPAEAAGVAPGPEAVEEPRDQARLAAVRTPAGGGAPLTSPEPEPEPSIAIDAPSFGFSAGSPPRSGRPAWHFGAAAVLAIGIAAGAWAWTSRPAAGRGGVRVATGLANQALDPALWPTMPAGDATGVARSRSLTAFQPSRDKRDYRLEAEARIDQQAMGIVMRVRDPRNYYCWKVELPPARSAGAARLIQFAVIDGREQPHRVVSFAGSLTPEVRVRAEARGPVFTLHINGVVADTFTDARIATGAAGFSNESGERAVIRTARVTD
jgi:hypothetical protein